MAGILKIFVIPVAVVAILVMVFAPKPDVSVTEQYNPPTVEMGVPELESWVGELQAAGMNVDVKVQPHAWKRHNAEATDAIRCLTNNGTHTVLSEKNSRNLHLICVDPNTQQAWVVIIERIRRYSDTLTNATSKMITAFELKDVTVAQYITWETTVKSIVVRLAFKAGELFFAP